MYVYFATQSQRLETGRNTVFKIGVTSNVDKRLRLMKYARFQQQGGKDWRLFGFVVVDGLAKEGTIHDLFSDYYTGKNELFSIPPNVIVERLARTKYVWQTKLKFWQKITK